MGNTNYSVNPTRINSMAIAVQIIVDNQLNYDRDLVLKIVLDFNRYLSRTDTYSDFGTNYVPLDKEQYEAFIRINKMLDELKPVHLENKGIDEKKKCP